MILRYPYLRSQGWSTANSGGSLLPNRKGGRGSLPAVLIVQLIY